MRVADRFVRESLDLPVSSNIESVLSKFIDADTFDGARFLSCKDLHTNLAYYSAWKSLIGVFPSRLEFDHFCRHAQFETNPESAFLQTVSSRMPIFKILAPNKLAEQAWQNFQRAGNDFKSSAESCKRLLLMKLVDRYIVSSPQEASDMVSLLAGTDILRAFAMIFTNDRFGASRTLRDVEGWSRTVSTNTNEMVSSEHRLASVDEYFSRCHEALRVLDMEHRNPINGFVVEKVHSDFRMTFIETLRHNVSRDGYIWRKDFRGAIYVLDPLKAHAVHDVVSGIYIRRARIPWRVFSHVMPNIYQRVIVATASVDECDHVHKWGMTPFMVEATPEATPHRMSYPCMRAVSEANPNTLSTDCGPVFPAPRPSTSGEVGHHPSHPRWLLHLQRSILVAFATYPADDPRHSYFAFIARYVLIRQLHKRVFTHNARCAKRMVVAIDTRCCIWTVLSILVTLDNVDPLNWGVRVFCNRSNEAFLRECLHDSVPNASIEPIDALDACQLSHSSGTGFLGFEIESYNTLLKSPAFWELVGAGGATHALIVQDDGVICRPGIDDDRFLSLDYVGAPWLDCPSNKEVKQLVGDELVGNGGLSLRKIAEMRRIANDTDVVRACGLFNQCMQPLPEDVFFAMHVSNKSPADVGEDFAFEQRPPPGSKKPLGMHKPWGYIQKAALEGAFASMLRDARDRPLSPHDPLQVYRYTEAHKLV